MHPAADSLPKDRPASRPTLVTNSQRAILTKHRYGGRRALTPNGTCDV